ncbi:tetratricopeptide repeat protein [Algoriphagus hitonicola]|uniref:Tetratricopeptide repeat-containing protein n=1 Tax=Algoriphagus hitonicola TaxID=435880 RepID=A0A1I2WKE7_9BACT|nr:tetratricopeptide repeat protein [Algoriphagus hitonicola]SFH01850.1 Tetratricopeptide repeat-containing protein [Algoriphagus hitonicola]
MLRKIHIPTIVLITFWLCSCQSTLNEAESLFKNQEYEEVVSKLNNYLFFNVTDLKALHLRARSYEELDRIPEAIADYERIIDLDRDYAQAFAGIGKIYFNQKNYKDAELALLNAANKDPEDYEILYLLARTLLINENYRLAEEFFMKARDINRKDPKLHFYQGMARAMLGDVLGCAASFNSYVQYEPDNVVGRYNRGFALMHVGYLEWALEDFEAVLKQNPNHVEALAKKGICLTQLGDSQGCRLIQEAANRGSDYAQSHLDLCS